MLEFCWLLVAFHLYMLQWGKRAYWRQVYITIASHEAQ